jgi:hypothetical protein
MKVHWVGKWLEFEHEARVVRLQGVVPKLSTCHQLSKVQLNWILKQEAWEHILELSVKYKDQFQNIPLEMAQLVEEYHELFDKPAGLPPPRKWTTRYHCYREPNHSDFDCIATLPTVQKADY